MENKEFINMYVVYKKPSDFPTSFVARYFKNTQLTRHYLCSHDYKQLEKALISMGKVNRGRNNNDDPEIMEVWI